ncbi:MAG: choice-of-anchor J domain-containing protein [Alloprevotella sp.]|nr:choice-of-anchor J domain-containing protein [Alloprevotella sp.]
MKHFRTHLLLLLAALIAPAGSFAQETTPLWATDFEDPDAFGDFVIIDGNGDGHEWLYDDFLFAAYCSRDNVADDWLVLPAVTLEAGRTYFFSLRAAGYSTDEETFDVCLGRDATASALSTVLYSGKVSSDELQEHRFSFQVTSSGSYRLAVHYNTSATAFAGSLTVDDISLESGAHPAAPAEVTDLTVTPGAQGALTASVSFTTPAVTAGGASDLVMTHVDVLRDDALVKRFDSPQPAARLTFEDTGVSRGLHTYRVVAVNEDGSSVVVAPAVFVGVDTPLPPTNVHASLSGGKVTLTWDAPTAGVNGGYIDATALTYTVTNNKGATVRSGISGTSLEDTPAVGTEQSVLYYYVTAVAGGASSERTRSNMLAFGEPSTLPYYESFAGGQRSTFWVTEYDKRARFWPLAAGAYAQDGDDGVLCFNAMEGNEWSRYFSGPITLKGAANPTLTFYLYYIDPIDEALNVEVSREGGDFRTVLTVPFTDESRAGKYTKINVPLKDYAADEYIQIAFSSYMTTTVSLLYIDNLSIRDVRARDLSVQKLTPPRDLKVGEQRSFTVTVANVGTEDVEAGAYTVGLFHGDRQLASSNGRALASEASRNYIFNVTADINLPAEADVYAAVSYAEDEDGGNDRSGTLRLTVHPNYYPVPQALRASESETAVTLSWEAPAAPRTEDGSVTEDFEDAPDFAVTDFADWTLYDGDKGHTYGITMGEDFVYFPHNGEEMAFIVMNAKAVGLPSAWYAHSGEKMMAAMSTAYENDNWLISPQLSGSEQTVSFYAKSVSSEYPETYQVLYSTTDVSPTSFRAVDENVTLTSEWTLCRHELPEGARYFAIRSIRENGFALFVDDVTFCPDSLAARDLQLLGFNVYRDGEKLNATPLPTPAYTEPLPADGTAYRVTAVYAEGESAYSGEVYVGQTGIAGPTEDNAGSSLVTRHSSLTYDLQGRRVARPAKGVFIVGGRKVVR